LKNNAMNYALIVNIITVFITIAAGFLPIVSYGQYMTYSPASTQTIQPSQDHRSNFQNENQGQTNCSSDWYVTGYFTPKESDYSGLKKTIFVHEIGNMSFYKSFLNDVRIEGAGETHFGWYIVNHGHGWTKISYPPDSVDGMLKAGESVATDPSVIPTGTNGLTIRTLPSPWNTYQYRAVDTGPSIIGKHIDVYIGIGAEAEKESYRITGHGNTVCYKLKM